MHYVYRLQSIKHPSKTYIGTTRNVKKRLALHNRGKVRETAEHAPWRISFYAAFTRKERAGDFKEFLETKDGKRLAVTYLWSSSSSPSASSSSHADG
jgi:predicted GIY-YIG superfamily endonuclease